MKKTLSIAVMLFCLLIAIVFAVSLNKEQKQQIHVCKEGCLNESSIALQICNDNQKACLDSCKNESAVCNANISIGKEICFDSCQNAFNVSINQTLNQSEIKKVMNDLRLCKRSCTLNAREAKKECRQTHCRTECGKEKQECVLERNDNRLACFEGCQLAVLNQTFAPENGSNGHGNGNHGCKNETGNATGKHSC